MALTGAEPLYFPSHGLPAHAEEIRDMADPPVPIVLGEFEPTGRIPGNTLFAKLGQRHVMGPRPFSDTGVFQHPFADRQSLRFTEGFDGLTQFHRHAHTEQDD